MISRVLLGKNTSLTQPFHYKDEWKNSEYWDYYHSGVDLTGFNGYGNVLDWIVAHTDGQVVDMRTDCTGFEQGSYGNYVLLKHANGYFTMYAHLAYGTVKVKMYQAVKQGTVLGYMDNTGTSYGGHLHFELRSPQGVCIDPEAYLNKDLPGMRKIKPLRVDGLWKASMTRRLEIIFGLKKTGVIKNQKKSAKKLCPACDSSWKWKKDPKVGAPLIMAIQKWVGTGQTGWINRKTIEALQKKFKLPITGELNTRTVKRMQKWINKKLA